MSFAAAFLALVLAHSVATPPGPDRVPPITSVAGWNDDATTLGFQIEKFDQCRGSLGVKHRLGPCLQMWDDAYKRVARMEKFAAERLAAEPASAESAQLQSRSKALHQQLDNATDFIQPEVKKLGRARITQIAATDKAAASYKKTLDQMLKN